MFVIALATAAAQLSAPTPVKYPTWFSLDDNPSYLHEDRTVLVRATVRPDGSLQSCDVESTSGDPKLDAFTCNLVIKRAHYQPAHWMDGNPAYGVDRMRVVWGPPSPMPSPETRHGDIDVTVDHLPKGIRTPSFVRVAFASDEVGHVVSCARAEHSSSGNSTSEDELTALACQQLMSRFTARAPSNDLGKAVPSVQNGYVRISGLH